MQTIKPIAIETLVTLMNDCTEDRERVDLGATLVSVHLHPQYGPLVLISSAMDGRAAVVIAAAHADAALA